MNCQSCGMPLNTPAEHAMGNEQNPYCVHCADTSGNLKSKEEVREGMINFYTQTEGKTREEAEQVVDAHMAMQPAWSQGTPSAAPVEPVEPAPTTMPEQPISEPTSAPMPEQPVNPEPSVAPVAPVEPVSQPQSMPGEETDTANTAAPKAPAEETTNPVAEAPAEETPAESGATNNPSEV